MKTQIIKSVWIIYCMLFCLTIHAQDQTKKADLKGSWVYSLPDAPHGYQDGTVDFKNVEGKLTANVKIGSSSSIIKIDDFKKNKDDYTCSLFVDGSDVKVTIKPETNKITGMVIADNWEMPITLTPHKK